MRHSPPKAPASALGREPELRFLDRRTPAAQWETVPNEPNKK